jgi:PhnB protein
MTTQLATASIALWLSVADAARAVAYYVAAFGADELERLEVVAQLAIDGSAFWVQQDELTNPVALGGRSPVRMILTVNDPDRVFAQAIVSGAIEISPINEEYGWRTGRLIDPFGHHWEIGKPVTV